MTKPTQEQLEEAYELLKTWGKLRLDYEHEMWIDHRYNMEMPLHQAFLAARNFADKIVKDDDAPTTCERCQRIYKKL